MIISRINFALVVLVLTLAGGCDGAFSPTSDLETESQLLQADAKHQAAIEELNAANSKLEKANDRAIKAEENAVAAEARYQAAVKKSAEMEAVVDETNLLLANAEKRIVAAQQALAEKIANEESVSTTQTNLQTKILSWNVESDGSDPAVIAKQLAEFKDCDIFALTEVLPEAFPIYGKALGDAYGTADSKSGNSDRMQILYNLNRFIFIRDFELNDINFQYRYRSPLAVQLKDRRSNVEFIVMVNHLARGNEEIRTQQAEQLVEWARDQNLPVIAVGDYNFDYVFADKNGNEGFRAMLRDNIWKWIEPAELIDTNWYDNPTHPDGEDDYPGSMLDFAFVAGSAKTWDIVCNVIVRDGDFPDDEKTSDHRPFELLINP